MSNNERLLPNPQPADLVTFTVKVNNTKIKDTYSVSKLVVDMAVNKISTAFVVLFDGDVALEDFEVSNSEDFIPGNEIEILCGYDSNENTIFKGVIIKHAIKIKPGKGSTLELECKAKAFKMALVRKNRVFSDKTDSDILKEIIGNYGITVENPDSTSFVHPTTIQHQTMDWDFVVNRAERNGLLLVPDADKLIIKKPEVKAVDSADLVLVYGATIQEFEAEIDSRHQLKAVDAHSWSSSDQKEVKVDAQEPVLTEQGNLQASELAKVSTIEKLELLHTGQLPQEEITDWANAILLRSRLSKIRGRVTFQGYSTIKISETVVFKGVGNRFNGAAFVSAIRHNISEGNWQTQLGFGLSPEPHVERYEVFPQAASGLISPTEGLHIGVVAALEGDPDSEERIKIILPMLDSTSEGIWARVAVPDAGNERSVFFRPEINDEVIVGFLNNDPRNPIVLGCLHSSALPSPIELSDDNHEKGIVTRSKMKMIFNDEKKSLCIETPKGKKVTIDEDADLITIEDDIGNKFKLDADGITMESAKDFIVKANGDITLEGININLKASAQLKAEGSAGAELKAGGNMVVKGAMVQIN